MNRELPRPEQERVTEYVRIFDVDAMSDERIYTVFTRLVSVSLLRLDNHEDDRPFMEGLINQLTVDVFDLATRNPERVRDMVRANTDSDDQLRQEFAATMAPSLLDYDYDFTRDTLISLAVGEAADRGEYGFGHDVAEREIRTILRDRLTPEQVSDWQARYARCEPHVPLEPAWPDEG